MGPDGKRQLIGLTRPMLRLYFRYMRDRKNEQLKMQARMMGVRVDEDEQDTGAKEGEARERLENPLKNFPDDVNYFSEKACKAKIAVAQRFRGRMLKQTVWDEHRMHACLGKRGPVAKRCSMNDVLWQRYLERGDGLSLEAIKNMVYFDMVRRQLYPPDYKGTGEEEPPAWYLGKLKAEGRLDEIYGQLDMIGTTGGKQ